MPITENAEKSLSSILLLELERRREKNPRYSLRSFARDLQLSASVLSDAINNKRQLSRDNLGRVAARLSMPFLMSAPALTSRGAYHKLSTVDEQTMASSWYHYALFGLAQLKSNNASPEWISRRLRITSVQAKRALHCLQRLKLIEVRANRMIPLKQNFESSTDIPSQALRKFHLQNLKRAMESLEQVAISDRDITSMTLAFAEKDMRIAKDYIRKFRRRFTKRFETTNGTDVYTLAVQLFPQTLRPDCRKLDEV